MGDPGFRYAVIRAPGSGPPALAGAPNDFATEAEALARVAEIEQHHRKSHHTHLSVFCYSGGLQHARLQEGILPGGTLPGRLGLP